MCFVTVMQKINARFAEIREKIASGSDGDIADRFFAETVKPDGDRKA